MENHSKFLMKKKNFSRHVAQIQSQLKIFKNNHDNRPNNFICTALPTNLFFEWSGSLKTKLNSAMR
jgi:hypothetical protein